MIPFNTFFIRSVTLCFNSLSITFLFKLHFSEIFLRITLSAEDTLFNIDRQQVVVQHGASLGLEKYNKYVLRKYKEADKTNLVPQNLEREVEELKVEGSTEDSLSEEEIMDESANVYFKSDKKH